MRIALAGNPNSGKTTMYMNNIHSCADEIILTEVVYE